MADFGCFAWSDSPELRRARARPGGDLDLSRLGVSDRLRGELEAWHAEWERAASGQRAEHGDDPSTWEERGYELARQLQSELPDLDVQVWDEARSQPVSVPDRRDG
jgi:hypothetical protein